MVASNTGFDPARSDGVAAAAGQAKKPAVAEWENEGGGLSGMHEEAKLRTAAPATERSVGDRADALMGIESVEGTPPSRRTRTIEWWGFAIGAAVLGVGAVVAMAYAEHLVSVFAVATMLGLMSLAAAPVWGAALLRGREHRRARREAEAEVQVVADYRGPFPRGEGLGEDRARTSDTLAELKPVEIVAGSGAAGRPGS